MIYSRPLRSFLTLVAKITLIAVLFFTGSYAFQLLNNLHLSSHMVVTNVDADSSVNVWWPTDGARIADTQTFKAVVPDMSVGDYDMFWSVDGGQQVKMYDSSTDYPHKEAVVDLSTWDWKNTGSYSITFTALDHSGNKIGENTIIIGLPNNTPASIIQSGSQIGATLSGVNTVNADSNGTTSAQVSSTQASSTLASVIQSLPIVQNPVPIAATSSVASTTQITNPISSPVPTAEPITTVAPILNSINVWWPTDGSSMQGNQPFKAVINGEALSQYKMYWQVDGGQLNEMSDNQDGGSHKENVVDLSQWTWKGNGPYQITFVAKNTDGTIFAQQKVTIYNNGIVTTSTDPVTRVVSGSDTTVTNLLNPSKPTVTSNISNPLSGSTFYLDLNNDAENAANSVRSQNPDEARQLDKIGKNPTAIWLGNWNTDVKNDVATVVNAAQKTGSVPTFVVYNIPSRDCGQYSGGGAGNPDGYRNWISQIAAGAGNSKVVFIVEPDSLALTDCLSPSQKTDRYALISHAVTTLKNNKNAAVYIDAGHPNWIPADDMANRLQQAGVNNADGFALNISNFYSTQANIDYGTSISSKVGGKHFVIDTGRNGLGAPTDNSWCNPAGRALGSKPTTDTSSPLVDAFLWLKGPGGSDGNCNGGPSAGTFWIDAALDMARRSAI